MDNVLRRKKPRLLNKDEILSLVDLSKAMNNRELAIYFNVHLQTIIRWKRKLRAKGYEMPPPHKTGRPRIKINKPEI